MPHLIIGIWYFCFWNWNNVVKCPLEPIYHLHYFLYFYAFTFRNVKLLLIGSRIMVNMVIVTPYMFKYSGSFLMRYDRVVHPFAMSLLMYILERRGWRKSSFVCDICPRDKFFFSFFFLFLLFVCVLNRFVCIIFTFLFIFPSHLKRGWINSQQKSNAIPSISVGIISVDLFLTKFYLCLTELIGIIYTITNVPGI